MSKKEEVIKTLIDMGYSEEQSNNAWDKASVKTMEGALDYLTDQTDEIQMDQSGTVPSSDANKEETIAKSLKCDECGKLLKSAAEAELHAAHTKHLNFSESSDEVKPLTQEQKEAQRQKLEETIKEKAKERVEMEKKQANESEKKRRIIGKEIAEAKKDRELVEAKLLAEQRKREREDDRKAKNKIREEIERDRKTKIAERESEKQLLANKVATSSTGATNMQPSYTSKEKKVYTECKINIKLADGTPLSNSFKPEDTLSAVREYIINTFGDPSFTMRTTFPTKIYSSDEESKTLQELGLVPAATLYCNKI